jgi:4-amino-4-deoxy-L-arabinose transferase-like glycosyltransferase
MDPGREGVRREGGLSESSAFLLVALAAWLAGTAWLRPLLLPDEGRYATVAWEMLHGDRLVPTLNGLPFFHKPPLFYWLDIAAMQVLGANPFSARFGSLVGAWLMGAALFFALRRWHGPATARLALVVLATCPFYFLAAQYANHDMLVGGLITVAVVCFVRAVDALPAAGDRAAAMPASATGAAATAAGGPAPDTSQPALRWIVAAWVACGFALLAKGLIGVVLPALVVGPWLLARGRWRDVLRLLHPLGLVAFALVAGPWLVAMQTRFPGFLDYFIVEQHFRRYAQSNFNNVHPFWFFVVVLPALTLPWSGWLAARARTLWRTAGPTTTLLAWWVVAVVGFFSLPSSKLVGYALPALAPWCALVALGIGAAGGRSRAVRWSVLLGAAICLGVPIGLAWKGPPAHRAVGLALAARIEPGDRVAMVDDYLYDVPFHARLIEPIAIASDWADPDVPRRDNWRKELFDAARFEPARARRVLWPIARLDDLACGTHAVWFVVRAGHAARARTVPGATPVWADAQAELWRAPGRSGC